MPFKRTLLHALYRVVYRLGIHTHDGGVTILSYHALDNHPTDISVPPALFAVHMAALAEAGCVSLTMREVAAGLAARRPFPRRAVAITFDDGFADVATQGAPILAHYGLSATVYVISGMIGRSTQWTFGGAPLPSLPLLTWAQIADLQVAGIEIGAHTVTHPFLTQCSPLDLAQELGAARTTLETALGTPVRAFAYPQGDYNPAVVAAVRAAGYNSAVTVDQGRAYPTGDPFRLPRLHISRHTPPAVLRAALVPTIGPTYRLLNMLIRGLLRRRTWPRPPPSMVQSTGLRPETDTP